jgi:hypothetical protein
MKACSVFFARLREVASELAEEAALSRGAFVDLASARVEWRGPGRGVVSFDCCWQDLSQPCGQLFISWESLGDCVRLVANAGGKPAGFGLKDAHEGLFRDLLDRAQNGQQAVVCRAVHANWARHEGFLAGGPVPDLDDE